MEMQTFEARLQAEYGAIFQYSAVWNNGFSYVAFDRLPFETDVKYAFVHYHRWIESAAFWTWKKNTSQRGIWDTVEKKITRVPKEKTALKALTTPVTKKINI